jgi:hypothetical protein
MYRLLSRSVATAAVALNTAHSQNYSGPTDKKLFFIYFVQFCASEPVFLEGLWGGEGSISGTSMNKVWN